MIASLHTEQFHRPAQRHGVASQPLWEHLRGAVQLQQRGDSAALRRPSSQQYKELTTKFSIPMSILVMTRMYPV